MNHKDVEIVLGQTVCFPENKNSKIFELSKLQLPSYSNNVNEIRSWFLHLPMVVWNKLIRTDFLKRNHLYFKKGQNNDEDYLWHLSSYFYISSIAFTDKTTYYYRQRQDSISTHSHDKHIKSRLSIYPDLIKFFNIIDTTFYKHIFNELAYIYKDVNVGNCSITKPSDVTRVVKQIASALSFKRSIPFRFLCLPYKFMPQYVYLRLVAYCHKFF
jgi:hypothetical protein